MKERWQQASITPFVIVLLIFWWLAVTLWYPIRFSIWLVRRDIRKQREHKNEATHEPRA